jgi:hypothetical protein
MPVLKNKTLVHRLPLTEARNNLGKVVRRAYMNNETFILEKDGIPIAALMNIGDFEDYLETQDSVLSNKIKQSYEEYLSGKSRPVEEFIAELKDELIKKKKK